MARLPTPREMGTYLALTQIGMEMVLPAVAGIYLDRWLDTVPWITCVLAVVGFAAGLIHLLAIVNKKPENDKTTDNNPP